MSYRSSVSAILEESVDQSRNRATSISTTIRESSKRFIASLSSHSTSKSSLTSSLSSTISRTTTKKKQKPTARNVHIDDETLEMRAAQVDNAICFDRLTNLVETQWEDQGTLNKSFRLFTRSSSPIVSGNDVPEVMVTGEVACSVEELADLFLCASSHETSHNSVMQTLYKRDFIFGSVVHVVPLESSDNFAASTSSYSSTRPMMWEEQLAVKTSCFTRHHPLANNEEWCYLENFRQQRRSERCTLIMSSMDASELGTGKTKVTKKHRVDQVHGVTVAYSFEPIAGRKAVRVIFYGRFSGNAHLGNHHRGFASTKVIKHRLLFFARRVPRLIDVIRQRRLGVQVFADRSAIRTKNSHCICCTKSLYHVPLLIPKKKKRCYLCAYYVCERCWSREKLETYNGHIASIVICTRCHECVDRCDYSNVQRSQHVFRGPAKVHIDAPNDPPTGQAVINYLIDTLAKGNTSNSKNQAAVSVIKLFLNQQSNSTIDYRDRRRRPRTEPEAEINPPLEALQEYLRAENLPLEECVLANAEQRNYPLHITDLEIPDCPVPSDEANRLQALHANRYLEIGTIPELEILCEIAAREMNSVYALVTLLGQDYQLVLASNVEPLRMANLPRNHTFCQHLIMDDKPLVINFPEADVRFYNLNPVVHNGVQFYCGSPITGKDDHKTLIGSLCCLDVEPRLVTRSQYSTMCKLAQVASDIIHVKSQELLVSLGHTNV